MSSLIPKGRGWIPDLPDPRDFTYRHRAVCPLLHQRTPPNTSGLPDAVDLTQGDEGELLLPGVEEQGRLNTSTAFAVLQLIEYFERRQGRTFSSSKLFLYKVIRNLRSNAPDLTADTGADLRTAFKVIRQYGVPDEEHWPYDPAQVNQEPSAFVYQSARRVPAFHYVRLDAPLRNRHQGHSRGIPDEACSELLRNPSQWDLIIAFLSAGFPVAFGFNVPASITADPDIPCRHSYDRYLGGMAALAFGYDLHRYGRNRGALQIRTSWGKQWGARGNGWLPASMVEARIADDFWTVLPMSMQIRHGDG